MTLGRCFACKQLTAAVEGPAAGVSRGTAIARRPGGYRHGYAFEGRQTGMVCAACLAAALRSMK